MQHGDTATSADSPLNVLTVQTCAHKAQTLVYTTQTIDFKGVHTKSAE